MATKVSMISLGCSKNQVDAEHLLATLAQNDFTLVGDVSESDVVIINRGKTVLKGNLKEIKDAYPAKRLEVNVKQDITSYITELGMNIEKNIDNNYEINIDNEEQAHILMKNLVNNNISIDKFELKKPSLNDIFIEKVGA